MFDHRLQQSGCNHFKRDFLFLSCAFIDSETAQSELLCCKTMWSDFFKEEEEKEKICISVRISIYLFNDVILASSSYDLQLGLELFASIRVSDSKSETLSLSQKKAVPTLGWEWAPSRQTLNTLEWLCLLGTPWWTPELEKVAGEREVRASLLRLLTQKSRGGWMTSIGRWIYQSCSNMNHF